MKFKIKQFSRKDFDDYLTTTSSESSYYQTTAGILRLSHTAKGIYHAAFCEEKPSHVLSTLPTQLLLRGTPFQISVWNAALQIPAGKTVTYQEIAQQIGKPNAWRAVANALAHNQIAYFIPCHRVVRTNGALGGYKWGIEKKQTLLFAEKL